jgi:subtilisin-like proprotein convertase family protein
MKKYLFPLHKMIRNTFLLMLSLVLVFGGSITATRAQENEPPEEPRAVPFSMDEGRQAATAPTNSAGIATADPNGGHAVYDWPIAWNQMGHLFQSYQNYGSNSDGSYFHHGIDLITSSYNVPVYAVSGGRVVNIENYNSSSLYWEVAILDPQGYVWQYHHINNTTIPAAITNAFNLCTPPDYTTCGSISAGSLIGNNVQWPTFTFGFYFHHIHLNILADGDVYINPLEFFTPINDTQAPEILAIGLLKNNVVMPGNLVGGDYGLYVRTRDLYQSLVYHLPPHKIEFSMDGGPMTTVWEFHTFPGGANDFTFVNDFYVYPPTCGNYSCRDFYIDLGFTTTGQRAFPTDIGAHTAQVCVWDFNGNSSCSSFTYNYYRTFENATSASIGDNSCSGGTGVTRTFEVTEDVLVRDVNVGLVITHADRGDIRVTLKAPGDATATIIVTNVGHSGTGSDAYSNYDVLVDDASSSNINDGSNDTVASPYYDRTAGPRPNASLDAFNGKAAMGTWTLFICDGTSGTSGTVNRVKVDLSGDYNPTAVEVKSFTASRAKNSVLLNWSTASEVGNLGYNLYRATAPDGIRNRLNAVLIPALPGSQHGAVYSYTDTDLRTNTTYYYWLEDVSLTGNPHLNGPELVKLLAGKK